jgi:hypothetical protein
MSLQTRAIIEYRYWWYLQKDIDVLEKVQKRALSMINGLNGLSYEEKLVDLGLEPLIHRRKFADLLLIFKVLNGYCTVDKNCGPRLTKEQIW